MEATAAPTQHIQLLEQYRENRRIEAPKLIKMVTNPLLFKAYMLTSLPMGLVAGLKVKSAGMDKCEITVPYRWMNKNPFSSTYFAVLSMAGEMSSGMVAMLATRNSNPSVSMLVTHLEADFTKKATGITTFTCNQGKEIVATVEKAILTGQPQDIVATSIGTSQSGEVEAKFYVQWSFRMRTKK